MPGLFQPTKPPAKDPGSGFVSPPNTAGFSYGGVNAYVPSPTAAPTLPPLPGGGQQQGGDAKFTKSKEGVLSGPGYEEDWYKTYGQDLMGTPSSSEDLYSKGAAGSNPFYDNAQNVVTKSINDASAARGNFNSSYTLHNIGTAVADLRGQQAHELGMLAGQADQGRVNRYDATHRFARDAQGATENRVRGANDSAERLARDRAGLVSDFYGPAGKSMSDAEMASIEVMLKKAGLSAEEIKSMVDDITNAAKAVTPFVGGGGDSEPGKV